MFDNLDYNQYAKMRQRGLERQAQQLQQKQAALQAAQNHKQKTTLESALSGLVGGLKERGSDILNTAKNIGKTVVGGINQLGANKAIENAQKDDSARRNEIAKKYGFNSYSEAINSGKVGDDFWSEIKSNNEKTKEKIEQNNARQGSFGDVTKINTNEAKGQALNTIDSVLGLLPGGAGVAANVLGGGLSGVGDEYKAAARENRDVNWTNARNNALVGAASGLAGSAGGAGMGKFASKAGTNALGKLAGTQLAKGIAGGAAAGAVGGGLGTYLNGGSLEDALLAAKEGAKAGGIGGGVMAGAMGLGGKALDKFRGRTGNAPTTDIEPVEATTVQKNRIEQPTAQRIEAEAPSARRGIAITDLDAGEQAINVRNGRPTESRGKYIDSVVRRSDANLPEAQRPIALSPEDMALARKEQQFTMLQNTNPMADEFHTGIRSPEEINTLRDLVKNYDEDEMFTYPDFTYADAQKAAKSPDITVYSSYPIEPGVFVSPSKMMAQDYATGNQNKIYQKTIPIDDFAAILSGDEGNYLPVATEAKAQPRKITIENALGQTQDVPVENLTTNYQRSTIPARQYDQQTVKNIPEAETATNRALMNAPEQRVTTQEQERQVAVSPSDQARLEREITVKEQKQGKALLEQYGPLDRPTRRAVGDPAKVLANLQDKMGLTTPAEVQYAANHITGGDGVLAKATNRLASLTTVDTRLEPTFIESLIEKNGLTEADAKAVRNQINGTFKKLGQNRKYTNGADVLDQVKQLQGIVRDYRGESGTYHNMTDAQKFKVNVIEAVAQELEDRLWNSADANMSQVITPELLTSMKQMYPDNAKWQNFVDNTVANAKTGKELRAIQKPLVQAGKIVRGSNMSSGSVGEAIANGAVQAGGVKGAAKNAAKIVADKFINSPKQQQRRANKYQQQKQAAEAQLYGETPIQTGKLAGIKEKIANIKDAGIVQGAKNLGNNLAERVNKNLESLNNESLSGIDSYTTRKGNKIEFNPLGNQAQQFANKQLGLSESNRAQNRLENAQAVANAQSDYDNALADYQAQEATYNNQMAQLQSQNANSQLDRIANAMEMALNAGDITAYGQLADLYTQAAKIEELRNPTTVTADLSAAQQKELNRMDTAANAIDELEKLYTSAGGGQGVIGGNIANLLGNVGINSDVASYNALSEGLINQIAAAVGKTDALNNEGEVKRALSLVPKITDTPQTAQTKLNTLREMLQTNRETMLSNYGA